jgi:pimeloyl-ACP methyl ester carboxylesterase
VSYAHGQVFDDEVARALEALAEAEDPGAGIRERFLRPTIGGGSTVAVLATPLERRRPTGWVVCHSFGMEQVNLATHEVPVARALAAAGFPVLRYHGQGYGDSELPASVVGTASHLRDALDAAEVLVDAAGVTEIGFLGARFGGTIAALAADRRGSALVAWEPVVRGGPYVRSLLTLSVMLQLMHHERDQGEAPDPRAELAERGVVDVQGFPLSQAMHDELADLDLTERLDSFAGRSLIVQISRGAEPKPELERLVTRLRGLGGTSELAVVEDERANTFAEPRYRPIGRGHKADIQAELGQNLVDRTTQWCAHEADAPSKGAR